MSAITTSKEKKSTDGNSHPSSTPTPETGEAPSQAGVILPPEGCSRSAPESCRETLRINNEEQAFHHHLTLGLQEKLQKNRMIRNVKAQFRKPVDKQTLSYWERKNGVVLPTDVKEYYGSTNGFKLTWSLEHAGDVLPIGELSINPLNQLVEIHQAAKQNGSAGSLGRGQHNASSILMRPKTCSADSTARNSMASSGGGTPLSSNSLRRGDEFAGNCSGDSGSGVPFTELEQTWVGVAGQFKSPLSGLNYNPSNKTFIIDSGRSGWGKVCLVYPSPPSSESTKLLNSPSSASSGRDGGSTPTSLQKPAQNLKKPSGGSSSTTLVTEPYIEIWFLDPSFQWHYLAPTFTHFYRMLLFHLGLPQWQYRFTPFGLSSWAEQMFWLVAPHLLQTPKLSKFPSMYHGEGLWCTDVPNEAATPNPSPNVLTNQLFRRKKKDRSESKYTN